MRKRPKACAFNQHPLRLGGGADIHKGQDMMTPTTPDPFDQPEFYSGIPTKRFMAWVVDALLVLIASVLILPFTAFTGLFFFPLLMLMVGFTYRGDACQRVGHLGHAPVRHGIAHGAR